MSGSSVISFNLFGVLFVVLCVAHLCCEKSCSCHVLIHIVYWGKNQV
uniref:Uncharacterized protein n=1 Tax=Setaria italica TaxID=4555 RepID=K3Z274_SETIT